MASDEYGELMGRLADEEYRREFASEYIGTGLAYQIRLLREGRGWTQKELAQRTGQAQGTISQLESPNYGRYSISTLKRLAAAFDVALLVRFAPFSELAHWMLHLTPQRLAPPSFADELEPAFARMVLPQDDSTKAGIPAPSEFVAPQMLMFTIAPEDQGLMPVLAADRKPTERASEERRQEYAEVA
jgi:transcriptional regulator with XRE-family HTH domain